MMVLWSRLVGDGDQASQDGFDLRYLDPDVAGDVERREPLATCWAARFEDVPPVRRFPSYQGQRSFSGLYFAVCMNRHVGFESWLERDQLTMLDFSPQVRAFSAQPFWLLWSCQGRARRHAPDFFVRLRDGTGVVVDVRADDRIGPEDADVFEVTAVACASVGWGYRRVGALDPGAGGEHAVAGWVSASSLRAGAVPDSVAGGVRGADAGAGGGCGCR
jgi:hypothetical protein